MRRRPRLLAALSLIAAVALALKLRLESRLLCLVKLAADRRLAALTVDTVGEGVQVQVNIAVWIFAQTAAMRTTQGLAAQLCCRGDVEEVLTQRTLQINSQVGAAGLERNSQ